MKPDLAVYWRAAGDGTAPWALDTVEASTVSGAQKPHVARCAWAWMNIAIVIERKEAEAGFNFSNQDEGQLLRDSKRGRKARAEHAAVVKEIMLRQHRTHAFTVYICDHWARAFRWDRNGAVVTEAIDLRERLDLFNALMFRLLHLDDKQLGYDTTAQLADVDDIKKLEMYEPPQRGFVHLQRHRNLITENQREYPIYKVCFKSSTICSIHHPCHRLNARSSKKPTPVEERFPLPPRHFSLADTSRITTLLSVAPHEASSPTT